MRWLRLLLSLLNRPPPIVDPIGDDPGTDIDDKLLSAHNLARESRGIHPLIFSSSHDRNAQLHSEWMARVGRLQHGMRFDRAENIAQTSCLDSEKVMDMWMKSRGHRRNILNASYRRVGFGVKQSAHGEVYWTVNFG